MKRSTLFGWGASIAALAVVILGFVQMGSPAEERARRFDQQRVSDLQNLTNGIDQYYNNVAHHTLPSALTDLQTRRDVFVSAFVDPESGTPYEYRTTGTTDYELCATFRTSSAEDSLGGPKSMPIPVGGMMTTWSHKAERTCFPFKVNVWNVKQ